jgi:two-component system sensor histidine kinase KdpD
MSSVPSETTSPARIPPRASRWAPRLDPQLTPTARVAIALCAVALATGGMLAFREALGVLNVMLLYIILAFALGFSLDARAATIGAVAAFVSYDILFIPPYGTLSVADSDHVLALFVFLAIAIGTSLVSARIQDQTRTAIQDNERTTLLYDLNRSLVSDVTLERLLQTIARGVVDIYGARASRIFTVGPEGDLRLQAVWPAGESPALDRQGTAMAQHAIGTRAVAGLGSPRVRIRTPHGTVQGAGPRPTTLRDALFVPITVQDRALGVVEVIGRPGGGRFTPDDERMLTSFADQVALAMERARLTEEATRALVLEESDELKSAMLAAVSHDLRTPLAAIKASASTLLDTSVDWPLTTRTELLEGIEAETDRLTLMVGNLLDLSRIEGGALKPQRDWYDVHDLVGDAVRQARRHAGTRQIVVDAPANLPLAWLDYVEIGQVLANLLGNAIKYSPDPSTVTVSVAAKDGRLTIDVSDEGVGIPPDRLPHIFDAFYRVHEQGPVAGSGIGLAICKGLVEAHGGTIAATSQIGRGTTVHVALPINGEDA